LKSLAAVALQDIARLHQATGACIAPVLDTQIAHALTQLTYLSLQGSAGGASLSGSFAAASMLLDGSSSVRRIGLGKLLELYGFVEGMEQKRAMQQHKEEDRE